MSRSSSSSMSNKKVIDRQNSASSSKKAEVPTRASNKKIDKIKVDEFSSDSNETNDDEPLHAPLQLKLEVREKRMSYFIGKEYLLQFVNSVMFRQWSLAKKLCHFMLMYEPNNYEAKQYAPLIDYMLNKEQSSSSDDDTSDDDDNDSDDWSDDDSSSSSQTSEDEEQINAKEEQIQSSKPVNASLSKRLTNKK